MCNSNEHKLMMSSSPEKRSMWCIHQTTIVEAEHNEQLCIRMKYTTKWTCLQCNEPMLTSSTDQWKYLCLTCNFIAMNLKGNCKALVLQFFHIKTAVTSPRILIKHSCEQGISCIALGLDRKNYTWEHCQHQCCVGHSTSFFVYDKLLATRMLHLVRVTTRRATSFATSSRQPSSAQCSTHILSCLFFNFITSSNLYYT